MKNLTVVAKCLPNLLEGFDTSRLDPFQVNGFLVASANSGYGSEPEIYPRDFGGRAAGVRERAGQAEV